LPTLPNGQIEVEHVWKKFRSDRAQPFFYDQLALLGRRVKQRGNLPDYRWVLKDVSFTVNPGESMALIGINGSGKTTLLKILSQVTYQSAGRCSVAGRIGALLSVTSGLHPDLNGRENIFLYGAVLGMGREDIRRKFDTIVEFAELADAIDRQVKFYSMGMQMRLGFSIAAFLEPDILLVDEVLSVGDANFQQKCLRRIGEIVRGGTTLLYVSHDLASVEATCDRAVWLSDAVPRAVGPTKEVVTMYRTAIEHGATVVTTKEGVVRVLKAELRATDGGQLRSECEVEVRLVLNSPESCMAEFFIGMSQGTAFPMFVIDHQSNMPEGDFEIVCKLGYLPLPKGHYSLWTAITGFPKGKKDPYLPWQPVVSFEAFGPDRMEPPEGVMAMTPVYVGAKWDIN
jgi:ABC-type polysaccharide/polyol phosphate transport system ATPase subunit